MQILNRLACPVMVAIGLGVFAPAPLSQEHQDDEGRPGQSEDAETQSKRSVQVENEAIDHVLEMLGAPRQLASDATARLVTVQTDNTPFLHEQIVGRRLWEVVVPKWRLDLASARPGVEDAYERTFDVLLDPESGNVLWVASRWPEGEPGEVGDLPPQIAEEQMSGWWGEEYHGFPPAKPATTFVQALDVVLTRGVGNPLRAKRITGHYVIQSSGGRDPRPMWVVMLQGIRMPAPGAPGDASIRYSRVMRNLVDARTGEWVTAVNFPKPVSGGN